MIPKRFARGAVALKPLTVVCLMPGAHGCAAARGCASKLRPESPSASICDWRGLSSRKMAEMAQERDFRWSLSGSRGGYTGGGGSIVDADKRGDRAAGLTATSTMTRFACGDRSGRLKAQADVPLSWPGRGLSIWCE